jgi:centractin
VTRHLQLLLRREGHIFKTSAEFEVVRTIKVGVLGYCVCRCFAVASHEWHGPVVWQEQLCYVPANPAKEEQLDDRSSLGKYRLPDGNEISVRSLFTAGLTGWVGPCGVLFLTPFRIGPPADSSSALPRP